MSIRLSFAAVLAALILSACGVKGDPVRPLPPEEPNEAAEAGEN